MKLVAWDKIRKSPSKNVRRVFSAMLRGREGASDERIKWVEVKAEKGRTGGKGVTEVE